MFFWDCAQLQNASASLPHGIEGVWDMSRSSVKAIPKASNRQELERVWSRIVYDYTRRRLTYPETDKLIALSAVAEWMSEEMDDEYIAGHFWKTLPISLNWQVAPWVPTLMISEHFDMSRRMSTKEGQFGRTTEQILSWSWASIDGPMFALSFQDEYESDDTVLADAVGYKLSLDNVTNPPATIAFPTSLDIKAYCAEIEQQHGGKFMLVEPKSSKRDGHVEVRMDNLDDDFTSSTRFLIAALIDSTSPKYREGLVLKQLGQDGEVFYKRLGRFRIDDQENNYGATENEWKDRLTRKFSQEKVVITLV